MSWLARVALAFLHALYELVLVFGSLSSRTHADPRPLLASRPKLPSHLALNLISDEGADEEANEKYMLNSVEKVVAWCQAVGIQRLTVYDREGVLANCSLDIRERVLPPAQEQDVDTVECDIRFPPTPPPSDDADSRPLSPRTRASIQTLSVTTVRYPKSFSKPSRRASVSRTAVKRRRILRNDGKTEDPPFILHILLRRSGKAAIAAAAAAFLHDLGDHKISSPATYNTAWPSIQELDNVLEGEYGFPSPDLMLVHRKPPAGQMRPPVEFTGFPPWQMRLTEIYWDRYPRTTSWWNRSSTETNSPSIEEAEFRRALDKYADAEMRLGK